MKILFLILLPCIFSKVVSAQVDWPNTIVSCLDGSIPGGSFIEINVHKDLNGNYKMCMGPHSAKDNKKWRCLENNVDITKSKHPARNDEIYSFDVAENEAGEYANLSVVNDYYMEGDVKFAAIIPRFFLSTITYLEAFSISCELNLDNK